MNKKIVIVLGIALAMLLNTGCASYRNQHFPDFSSHSYPDNLLYQEHRVILFEIWSLLPGDTISLRLNGKLIIPELTTNTPYPSDTCLPKYGGHNDYSFRYLLVRSRNGKSLSVYNGADPKKRFLGKVKTNARLTIETNYNRMTNEPNQTMELYLDTIPFAHIVGLCQRNTFRFNCAVRGRIRRG